MSIPYFLIDGKREKVDFDSLDNKPKLGSATLSKDTSISLGVDQEEDLLYVYVNGIRQGSGVEIGEGYAGSVILSQTALTVSEGSSASFTVALDTEPTKNQKVYLAASNPNLLSVSPSVLLFTPANYQTPQTVTVTALQDEDMDDNTASVAVTLRAKTETVAVTITDDDKPEPVTDGLALEFDFRNLAEEATTVVDTVGGVTLTNLITSDFHKVANGIYGSSNYKYAKLVTSDTAFANFKSTMAAAASTGFSVEIFGMKILTCLNTGNAIVFGTVSVSGYSPGGGSAVGSNTKMPYIDSNGDAQTFISSDKYPISAADAKEATFYQLDIVYNSDGTVNLHGNGGSPATWSVSDFGSWDIEKMLTPTNTYYLGSWQLGSNQNNYLTFVRYYSKPLSDSEIAQNIEYNKASIGISDFQ